MTLPFDPTTLPVPGMVTMREPAAYSQRIDVRADQAAIASDTDNTYVGALTTQYAITDYAVEADTSFSHFSSATFERVADDLATSIQTAIPTLPPVLSLEFDNPDRYTLSGEIFPSTGANAVTAPPINPATMAWFTSFLAVLKTNGYDYINSVSFEIIDFFMPTEWKQLDYLGRPGLSGWVPPSSFIVPTMDDTLTYMTEVQKQMLTAAVAAGHDPRFQIGEPWWWDGAYSNDAPCLYDPFTRALYLSETGNVVPTPWIEDITAPLDPAQVPYLEWLRDKLGRATSVIRDAVKDAFPTAQATLLFFTPQVLNLASQVTNIVNFPIDDWKYPAYDFVQIEDYDWIIAAELNLVPLTFNAARNILGYPQPVVHYFVGFVLNAQDYHIWTWAETAIRMAQEADMPYIYVWSYTQAIRDSILYDDLPPDALQVPILDLPPNWENEYDVIREYKTEIIVSRSKKEQRRALRRTPRKSVEYLISLSGLEMRRFGAALSAWQANQFFTPEITRSCKTTSILLATDKVLTVDALPGWLQLGTAVILSQNGEKDGRIVDQISDNTVTFTTANADGDERIWPPGTLIYPSLLGRIASPITTTSRNSQTLEATIHFDVSPASEPPLLNPPVALQTFNGVEVLTLRPNWSTEPTIDRSFDSETVDYGWGKTENFFPVQFSDRMMKATFLSRTRVEAEIIYGFFDRMKGQWGTFYMPTYQRDMEISPLAVPGVDLRLSGTEVADWLIDDTVYCNIAIITNDGVIHPYAISSIAKITTIDTLLTLAVAVTSDILARAVLCCWMPLSRLATDQLTVAWTTDQVAQFELPIQSLQNSET